MNDIANIKAEDRDVNLLHPKTGDELGLVFHLRSPYDDEVQKVQREWQNMRLHPKRRNKAITAEELDALQEKRIIAAVKGWTWADPELSLRGERPEYSAQVLKSWLRDDSLKWIRDFLVDETEDLASFF